MKERFLNTKLFDGFNWKADLIAAFTVTVLVVPQGMAYALLAGLPAIYGLYAAFIPLLVYPLFGSSRHLSVGPVALVSIILFAELSRIATPQTLEFIQLALLTSLLAGLVQVVLALFRMGFLVNFLSEPVIVGFTAAAAIIISVSQLKYVLGVDPEAGASTLIDLSRNLFAELSNVHLLSIVFGVISLLFIIASKKISKKIPAALLAVVVGSLLVAYLGLDKEGIQTIGEVPNGLPPFRFDFIHMENVIKVLPLALIICLISFIESLAIAKTLSSKQADHKVDPNRELFGLGLAKVVGSFFSAYPNTGSFSRSALNCESGASSSISSIIAGLMVGLVLFFCASTFQYLPKAILAAIVISAVVGLINISYVRKLFHLDRKDFYVFLATFLCTLLLGVQLGVFVGVILSLIFILMKSSKPHYVVLGRLPGTERYRNIERFDEAITTEDVLIMRYDEDVYFANANHFYESILKEIDRNQLTETFILNASSMNHVDSVGVHQVELLLEECHTRKIQFLISNLRGPVRDIFSRSDILKDLVQEQSYLSIQDAVESQTEALSDDVILSRKYAAQMNEEEE